MGRYRKIEDNTWIDPKIKKLKTNEKCVFIYLFSNSHAHLSGLYYLPKMYGANETALSDKAYDTALDTLFRVGLISFDPENEIIFVKNMFKHQAKGEKAERAAANHLETLHNSFLIQEFIERYPEVVKYIKKTILDKVYDRVCDTVSLQEQEQEQEQITVSDTPLTPQGEKKKSLKQELLIYLKQKIVEEQFIDYQPLIIEFFEYRMKSKHKYKSEKGINGLFRDLKQCVEMGYPIGECLELSMERDWRSPRPQYFKNDFNYRKEEIPLAVQQNKISQGGWEMMQYNLSDLATE